MPHIFLPGHRRPRVGGCLHAPGLPAFAEPTNAARAKRVDPAFVQTKRPGFMALLNCSVVWIYCLDEAWDVPFCSCNHLW